MLISELEMSSVPSKLQGRTYGSIYAWTAHWACCICTADFVWDERENATAKDWMTARLDSKSDRMMFTLVTATDGNKLKVDIAFAGSSGTRARMQLRKTGGRCGWQSDTTPSYTGSTPS